MSDATSDRCTRLSALLEGEREAWDAFCRLLEEEQAALAADDPDRLLALAQRKSAQVVHLSELAKARNAELRQATGLADQEGIAAFCRRHEMPGAGTVESTWQALLAAARAAHRLNAENGALIHARLQHNQQALAVLLASADQVAQFYGPDGQAVTGTPGRPLGKA
jgi:flagellar biosynthesis/type III secretory pathway chaperone